jgi:hypothetical protein
MGKRVFSLALLLVKGWKVKLAVAVPGQIIGKMAR